MKACTFGRIKIYDNLVCAMRMAVTARVILRNNETGVPGKNDGAAAQPNHVNSLSHIDVPLKRPRRLLREEVTMTESG